MDKNTIIGFVLIALVLIGFTYFNQPSQEQIAQMRINDSIQAVNAEKAKQKVLQENAERQKTALFQNDSLAQTADTTSLFASAKQGKNQQVVLQNNLVKLNLNTVGGSIVSATLKEYKNQQKQNVELFNESNSRISYTLALKNENIRSNELNFTPENCTDSTVSMTIHGKDGSYLSFDYTLIPNTYMVNLIIRSKGLEPHMLPKTKTIGIEWQDSVKQQEKGFTFENRYSTLTYKEKGESSDYLNEAKEKEETIDGTLDWVAFKNQFFSYVLINYNGLTKSNLKSTPLEESTGYLKNYEASFETPFDPTGQKDIKMQFYIGPNQFRLLKSMNDYSLEKGKDLELNDLVYLGWPLFKYINRYFTIYVFDGLTKLGFSMGIVLLLITILLRIIVYPATKKSYLSSAKMRVLRPKIDEATAQYTKPEDNMKKQQEIMSTYSKYGVSPMGGCLPILIQTPIWIAMFNFVPNAIELRQQSFLWADDLSTYDDVISWSTNLPFIGNHISLFCLLFCGSNLLYSWYNMRLQKESMVGQQADQMKMMQWMMMLMPVFFFFMFNDYSSGLNYYYFISLFAGAITMWWLKWRTDDAKLLAKLEENYQKNINNPQKMTNLAARLEALQKQQELQQRNRQK